MQHGGQVQVNSSAESQENNGSINYVLVLFLHTCPRVETTFAVCKWLCCSLFVKSILYWNGVIRFCLSLCSGKVWHIRNTHNTVFHNNCLDMYSCGEKWYDV